MKQVIRIAFWSLICFALIFPSTGFSQNLTKGGFSMGSYEILNAKGKALMKNLRAVELLNEGKHIIGVKEDFSFELFDVQTGEKIAQEGGLKAPLFLCQGNPFLILIQDSNYYVFDFNLKKITENGYREIKDPQGKRTSLLVKDENSNWGIINLDGTEQIPPQYLSLDYGGGELNGILYPVAHLFRATAKNSESFYINLSNEVDIAATANSCCYSMGEQQVVGKRLMLLEHSEKIRGIEKTLLGTTYNSTNRENNNPAEAFKWLYQGWQEAPESQYALVKLTEFLRSNPEFLQAQEGLNLSSLYRLAGKQSPSYILELAEYFRWENQPDSAKFYYEEVVKITSETNYSRVGAHIELAKIAFREGNKTLAAQHLNAAKKAASANQSPLPEYKLEELSTMNLPTNLKYGQVILYKGEKFMVLHGTPKGVELSNGTYLPLTETDFKVLNESADQFMTSCYACAGSGKVTKTFKMTPITVYSKPELVSGSKVSGDYIKTTSYTTPSSYEGQETCSVCYGKKVVLKK
ncbi:hypothetical protein D0X99_16800 [Algoriphagus lacus]|uniref:Tetratricopeptide repeat protein n=1 Tax=Algoriphagus lacus TaxID=2056311 RepID=A0A418PNK2_9BACT|nr:hypothetical protein [Algoriphagus lacus]RIW13429.1 hypothetical protein D0X99_16800 [Algoriphagus lacus]